MEEGEFLITSNESTLYNQEDKLISTYPNEFNASIQNLRNNYACCDVETTASSEFIDERYDGLVVISTFIVLLSITTVLSNGLVIHVLRTDKTLHTVSNYFALSLSLSDLLVGLIVIPLNLLHLHVPRDWDSYMVLHGIWVTLDFLLTTSSILNLVLLNLDRFWSITSPIKYIRRRTKRRALLLIGIVWGISTLLILVPAAIWPYVFRDIDIPAKTEFIHFGRSSWLMGSVSICVFFIPLITLCAIYSRIFKAIHSRSKLDLGRASVANCLPKKGSELQQGLINEQQLQRLQLIYDKAVKRERGERQLSALKKKLKHQYGTGAKKVQRYESINEERGSDMSLKNSEKGSFKRKTAGGMQIPTLMIERTSSSNSLDKRSPTKDFLSVVWNKGQWQGRQRVASVDTIRERNNNERNNSFCSDTTSSRPKQTMYNTSRSCEILAFESGITKNDSRRSLPSSRKTSPSGSPIASSHGSRGSVDNHGNSNFLQIYTGEDDAKCNSILRSHSSPGLSQGNTNLQLRPDDDDDDSYLTAGEVSIPVPVMPVCNCPRMRTLSNESSSPPTSPKELTEDTTSLLLPVKPPSPRGSIFRDRLASQTSRLRRTSFSAEMLTRPSSDSGYCSEYRQPSASYPQRQQSLTVPENINAIRERVRNSFSNSFSMISGQGSKALTLLKKQDKAARQLGVVLTCLVTCWTPYFVLILLYCFRPELANVTGMSVAVYLGYIHSLCNPILFTLFNLRFQRSFRKALCPCSPLEEVQRPCGSIPPPSML